MERRDALKNIALAFGSMVALPQLVGILTSCSRNTANKAYLCLSENQAIIIGWISQILMPTIQHTQEGGVDSVLFLDEMLYHTVSEDDRMLFLKGEEAFEKEFFNTFNKNVLEGTIQEIKVMVDRFLNIPEDTIENIKSLQLKDVTSETISEKPYHLLSNFLITLRYYCLFGYCTSKTYFDATAFYTS